MIESSIVKEVFLPNRGCHFAADISMIAQLNGNLVLIHHSVPDGLEMSGTFKEVRELVKREFGVLYCDSHLRLRELEMRCLKPIEQIWRWLKRVLSVKLMKGIEEMKGIIRSHLLVLVRRLSKTRKLFML